MSESTGSSNRRIALLAGQAFCLGLMTAWVAIPASAIFLDVYGSGLLPVTYIGAAVAGAATSASLGVALRRRPLVSVAMTILTVLAIGLLASWLLIWMVGADWLSFGLLVLVPILVPVGFMLVVAQAGMLLDVRALKSLYARVIAGFALGFVAGGAAGPPLLAALGRTEHLLAGGAATAGMFVFLVSMTRRNFSAELSVIDDGGGHDVERPTLRSLLRHRYVVLIVGFQMLSAVESQWLDYLVFDRAGKRYTDTKELADFISRFMAITYGADIIFLLLVAGVLMRRFGLRYGLTANPVMVLTLVAATITAAAMRGSGTTIVFVLIVASRVTDLVLSDGTSRTSLGAAYQAVPTHVRLATQATVEGLAVPVAIGASGVVLIAIRSTVGTDGLALPVLTTVVLVAWTIVAMSMYRGYRFNLIANLRHRSLDPTELSIEGASTLAAIHRLIDSSDERDVRLGLDTLTSAQHPDLVTRLQALARDERVGVRCDVLERLVHVDAPAAAAAARDGLRHTDPEVRETSVRVLGATGVASDLPAITSRLNDASWDVQVAAVTAVSRIGDDAARRQVAARIGSLSRAESPDGIVLAARMLAGSDSSDLIDRRSLRAMLGSGDSSVINAALAAVRLPDDRDVLIDVVAHLDDRSTAAAAVDALVRSGAAGLELADDVLGGRLHLGQHGHEQLARVCRMVGGSPAVTVLWRHAEHRDREVGLAVLTALAVVGSAKIGTTDTLIRADLEHATRVLNALVVIEHITSAGVLRSALWDEVELLQRRVLAGLAIRYGADEVSRIGFQLAQSNPRFHALALEWLDVTLVGIDRAAVALLEPDVTADQRVELLTRWFPVSPATPHSIVSELIEDPDDRWRRPWITACALLVAADMTTLDIEAMTRSASQRFAADEGDEHGHIVRETIAGIDRRQILRQR